MTSRIATGIFLSGTGAKAALVRQRRVVRRPSISRADIDTGTDIWGEDPDPMLQVFRKLARALPREARRADCPTRVSIPDPLVAEERLMFRDFPDCQRAAQALVSWRHGNDYHADPGDHAFAWQVLGRKDGQTDVLVRVANKTLCNNVRRAAEQAGFWLDRIDGWSGYWPEPVEDTAQLWASDGWWAVACSNRDGTKSALRSGWLDARETPSPDVTRAVRAFMLGAGSESIALSTLSDDRNLSAAFASDNRVSVSQTDPITDPAIVAAAG